MDFDDLEDKEEEFGGVDEQIILDARKDTAWQDYLDRRELERSQKREEEKARQELEAAELHAENFMMEKRQEWELWRAERRRQGEVNPDSIYSEPIEMLSWEAYLKKNGDIFTKVYQKRRGQGGEAEGDAEEDEQQAEAYEAEGQRGQDVVEEPYESYEEARAPSSAPRGRRRGAFSSSLGANTQAPSRSESEGPSDSDEPGGRRDADDAEGVRSQQAGRSPAGDEPDPTGLDRNDPTFAFVRGMIDANRSANKAVKKEAARRQRWQADVEDGVIVPYLAEVLTRIEEDEKADPDRPVEIAPLDKMLEKIEDDVREDEEFDKVKDFLPDIEKKRQELTLAIRAPEKEVPLATPAIQVLQDMYPEQDLAMRDALESFEVAQLWHEAPDEGYISKITAKRAKAASDEQEWLAWKAKEESKRRLRKEGLANMLPPAPQNAKIGSLAPSNVKNKVTGGSSSSSSFGASRGVGGPEHTPLARASPADLRPARASAASAGAPASAPAQQPPPPPPPPPESEEERQRREDWERQERARLSKERLQRMKERRRQRELGEDCQ